MKRLLPVLPILYFILSGCQMTEHQFNYHGRTLHTDDDWNLTFYENCSMPRNDSVKWIEEGKNKFIRFQLEDKHYGGCRGDRMNRFGTRYRERAEVRQTNSLKRNTKYELEFTVRFVEGFAGNRETFFQLHSWTSRSCNTYPPIMIKFSEGYLTLSALRKTSGRGDHVNYYSGINFDDLIGKWNAVKLEFDTSEHPEASLYLNENPIFSNIPYWKEPCGTPHFKIGIYRPGPKTGEYQLGWSRLSRSQSGLNRSVPSNKDIPETIGNIRDGGTKRSVIDFDKINLTVVDTDYEPKKRVFCWRKDKLISNSKIYPADKCEPGEKSITPYQSYAISDFLKEGLSEDRLREGVEFFLKHPRLEPE